MLLAKIVDDILGTGKEDDVDMTHERFHITIKIATVTKTDGLLPYFGFNLFKKEAFTVQIDHHKC